jgi:RNA 3'-terminal phosphate cyclase (ATP)
MLTVDGSHLEGGGQIVRTSVTLAALSGTPVTIERVREGRPNPGLSAQHIAAVKAVSEACGGETEGLTVGSTRLVFLPGEPGRTDLVMDIGTAGSIPLVLQAWLPVALRAGGSITLTGGTEVTWSPTIDYVDRVLAAVLRHHGASIEIEILRRGYYPGGGGLVTVRVAPSSLAPIYPEAVDQSPAIVSASANLPGHVASRQAGAAKKVLEAALHDEVNITLDSRQTGISTGSSVTAYAGAKGGIALGRRGVPAEEVGRLAAGMLLEECRRPGSVDIHLADQLLVYIAEWGGGYFAHTLSSHAATVCWLLKEFGCGVECRRGTAVEFSA